MSDIIELGEGTGPAARAHLAAYCELTKPRISGMVLLATALGFFLAVQPVGGRLAMSVLLHALLGTILVAGGANALNQLIEASYDGRMLRTRNRPLPSGRLTGAEALIFGAALCLAGVCHLAWFVNPLAAVIAVFALSGYVLLYTPLKRLTWFCVFVGAASGALPPVIGWTAATGSLTAAAVFPFAILFFWQLPHFEAIAWLYHDDYHRAGFHMMPATGQHGRRTTRRVPTHTLGLLAASLMPAAFGLAGVVYAVGATILGLAFLACGLLFVCRETPQAARLHLLTSVVYLPLLFVAVMVDKV